EAGYPNGFEVGFLQTGPVVEPALPQTSEAISADLAKVGIRTRRRYVGETGPFVNLVRDGKADPMFEWSWGYYSVFDADAILYDVMKCGEAYSYYCNKALDDLIIQGRSTLDQKKRAEIYARIQRLIFEDAAYLFLHVLGDPVLLLLPQNAGKEEFERYRKLLGLDQPLLVQYWKFASQAVQGDFGKSWYADTPAFSLVLERMPPTIYLTLAGL